MDLAFCFDLSLRLNLHLIYNFISRSLQVFGLNLQQCLQRRDLNDQKLDFNEIGFDFHMLSRNRVQGHCKPFTQKHPLCQGLVS